MKSKQCPIEQEHKQEALAELSSLEEGGVIELYFGDESGFCNVPVVAAGVAVSGRGNPHPRRREAKD